MTKDLIRTFYFRNGLKIDGIRRARLGDGFFVYHRHALDKADFIEDGNLPLLQIAVAEARNRAGLKGRLAWRLT